VSQPGLSSFPAPDFGARLDRAQAELRSRDLLVVTGRADATS
jgi:hypothetical protein